MKDEYLMRLIELRDDLEAYCRKRDRNSPEHKRVCEQIEGLNRFIDEWGKARDA